jgi:hypothetical protein
VNLLTLANLHQTALQQARHLPQSQDLLLQHPPVEGTHRSKAVRPPVITQTCSQPAQRYSVIATKYGGPPARNHKFNMHSYLNLIDIAPTVPQVHHSSLVTFTFALGSGFRPITRPMMLRHWNL